MRRIVIRKHADVPTFPDKKDVPKPEVLESPVKGTSNRDRRYSSANSSLIDEWERDISFCVENGEDVLSAWEEEFLDSLAFRLEDDKPLTPKQEQVLDRIMEKVLYYIEHGKVRKARRRAYGE